MLFDSHCHLDSTRFDPDRDDVISRARAQGVSAMVIPAVEPATWPATARCALSPERFIALGIHPQALPTLSREAVDHGLRSLQASLKASRAVAVGECGFDGTLDLTAVPWETQRAVFFAHADVARALDLPMVVHVLKASEPALDALRTLGPMRGVIHSYSGSAELVEVYLKLGWHLGFGGSITRVKARRPLEALRAVARDRLLIETDAPDQIPTGSEGVRCEPAHLTVVARRAGEALGISYDELAALTDRNARALFGLSPA